MNDPYLVRSIKSGKRMTHGDGEISQRVYIKRVDQKMLSGIHWAKFFNNPEKKVIQLLTMSV